LAEDGLEIVQHLSFAPNLYSVRVLSTALRETIDILQKKTDRYVFAEPSMIQTITGRSLRTIRIIGSNGSTAMLAIWTAQVEKALTQILLELHKGTGPTVPCAVAVIDNGMNINHEELSGAIIGGGFFQSDCTWQWNGATSSGFESGMTDFPFDGHGTLCLGMVGARG
jgi:hypothetical protein